MIVGLSFHHFGQDKELLVDAAVTEVVVAEEAVEAVVAVVQDQPRPKRAVWIVATKFFPAPLKEKTKQKVLTEMDIRRGSYLNVKEQRQSSGVKFTKELTDILIRQSV